MDMDFLASPPPDLQIDWMSAMMQESADFSQTPISPTPISALIPVPMLAAEAYRFDEPAIKLPTSALMKEMVFRMAAMQPVHVEAVRRPKRRRNVRISKDPQSVAARHRRERISERIRILQRMVPGGTKMDTASMLDEAVQYLKFLKSQVTSLERAGFAGGHAGFNNNGLGFGNGGGTNFFCSRRMEPAQDRCTCC